MKINQAAELAGITSKNIRFYEDQGLIRPGRDPKNGYREYSLEDVRQLERVKLLRQLGVSCESIRMLGEGTLGFDSCMAKHMDKLDRDGRDIEHMKALCRMLMDEVDDLSELDASQYLNKMNEMERGGVRFMNIKMSDVKKRGAGALIAAVCTIAFMGALLAGVIIANRADPAPPVVLAVCILIFGGIIVGVAAALVQRLRELKKGEIDEAAKY